jgi:hypothetical protein
VLLLSAALACALGGRAEATKKFVSPVPASPEAAPRRLLASAYWPRGVAVVLDHPTLHKDQSFVGLDKSLVATGRQQSGRGKAEKLAGARVGPAVSPAPRPVDPVKIASLRQEVTALERRVGELSRHVVELGQAGTDYSSMMVIPRRERALLPFLLFLVEKGILRKDEVQGLLETTDVDALLSRIRERIGAANYDRSVLEVRLMFARERLSCPGGAARRR